MKPKLFRRIRLAVNIVLGCGCFMILNDGKSFTPNLIGLACFALLIVLNPTGDAWLQIHDNENNNRK